MLASNFGYMRYLNGDMNAFSLPEHTDKNGDTIKNNTNHMHSATLSKGGVESAINMAKKIKNPNYKTTDLGDTTSTVYKNRCK